MGIAMTLWLDYSSREGGSKWYFKLVLLALALAFAGSIGYSRLFLGVHSLNQVLYGLSCGLWFAFTAHFLLREPMTGLVSALIDGKQTTPLSRLLLISSGLASLALVVQMINYHVALNFENP